MRGRDRGALVAFAAGLLLISYPLANVPNQPTLVAGVPLLYLYVFAVWLTCIGAAWLLARGPE